MAVSPGRTIRNTATAGSRRCSSDWRNRRTGARSAAITKLCRLVVGIGTACRGSRPKTANAESVQRTSPVTRFSSQRADAAEALRVVEQVGAFLGLPDRAPGEDHPGEERDRVHPGDLDASASPVRAVPVEAGLVERGWSGRGGLRFGAASPGHVLGAAAGQDPLRHGEQAVAGTRRRVRLKQRQPGELGGQARPGPRTRGSCARRRSPSRRRRRHAAA